MTAAGTFSGPTARDAILAFALAAAAYMVAAWKLAALSWDGSWYLFHSLQDRVPFTPHHRFGTYPVTWLVVRLSERMDDPAALGMVFGVLLAFLPLGSLALSWYGLRGANLAPLRVWPAMGILLAALPGQLCLVAEATLVAQLLWPMLALAASGPRGWRGSLCLLGLAVLAALLHPTAVLTLGLLAVLLAARAWNTVPADSRTAWLWTGTFLLLAAAKGSETMLYATGYERGQASLRAVYWQFGNAVLGYPICFLGLLYLLGVVILAAAGDAPPSLSLRLRRMIASLCFLLACVGCLWAVEVTRWSGLLDYRRFVLPAMLPLVILGCWHHHRVKTDHRRRSAAPSFLLSRTAGIFALVLAVQSFAWGNLLGKFTREIARHATQGSFLYADTLPSTRRTPLRHWSAIPLSVLLQGRRPRTIYVLRPESIRPGGMEVYPPDDIDFIDGWFALSGLDRAGNAPGKR